MCLWNLKAKEVYLLLLLLSINTVYTPAHFSVKVILNAVTNKYSQCVKCHWKWITFFLKNSMEILEWPYYLEHLRILWQKVVFFLVEQMSKNRKLLCLRLSRWAGDKLGDWTKIKNFFFLIKKTLKRVKDGHQTISLKSFLLSFTIFMELAYMFNKQRVWIKILTMKFVITFQTQTLLTVKINPFEPFGQKLSLPFDLKSYGIKITFNKWYIKTEVQTQMTQIHTKAANLTSLTSFSNQLSVKGWTERLTFTVHLCPPSPVLSLCPWLALGCERSEGRGLRHRHRRRRRPPCRLSAPRPARRGPTPFPPPLAPAGREGWQVGISVFRISYDEYTGTTGSDRATATHHGVMSNVLTLHSICPSRWQCYAVNVITSIAKTSLRYT